MHKTEWPTRSATILSLFMEQLSWSSSEFWGLCPLFHSLPSASGNRNVWYPWGSSTKTRPYYIWIVYSKGFWNHTKSLEKNTMCINQRKAIWESGKTTSLRGDQDSISNLKENSSMTLPRSRIVLCFLSKCWPKRGKK